MTIAFQQRDTRAFHGDVGAGAHRNAHVSGSQSGRVVDAVSALGRRPGLPDGDVDDLALILGQDFGLDLGHAELRARRSPLRHRRRSASRRGCRQL